MDGKNAGEWWGMCHLMNVSAVEGGLTKASCKETCFKGILPPCFDFAQHDMGIVHSHLVLTWDIVSLISMIKPSDLDRLLGFLLGQKWCGRFCFLLH
jgi:hypothetical protein